MEVGNRLIKLQRTRVASRMAGSKCTNVVRNLSFSPFQLSSPCVNFSLGQSLPGVPPAAPRSHLTTLAGPVGNVSFPMVPTFATKKLQAYVSLAGGWGWGHVSTSAPRPGARAKSKRSTPSLTWAKSEEGWIPKRRGLDDRKR